jgi:hypothetical protein
LNAGGGDASKPLPPKKAETERSEGRKGRRKSTAG